MIRTILICCVFLASTQTATSEDLVVRASSSVPDDVIRYVADNFLPVEIKNTARGSVEANIHSTCGYNHPRLVELAKTLNAVKPNSDSLILPACIFARQNAPVRTLEGDTLQILLQREAGVLPEYRLPCVVGETSQRCGHTFSELMPGLNPDMKLDQLPSNSTVVIPYQTHLQTIKTKPYVDASEALDKLRRFGQSTLIARRGSTSVLAEPLIFDDIRESTCKFAASGSLKPWPYDQKLLAGLLKRNTQASKRGNVKPAIVAILDTGILWRGTVFPERVFAKNVRRSGLGASGNKDSNGYRFDIIGINTLLRGDVAADSGYKYGEHGSETASLALGGRPFFSSNSKLDNHVQLKIVKIVVHYQNGEFAIPDTALNLGLKYAKRSGAAVANISVGTSRKDSEILGYLQIPPGLIAVVAAGNAPGRLDDGPIYPASFGGAWGDGRNNVITVIAHDAIGKPAEFSSYGQHYADIAAPGCDLASPNNKGPRLYGTSFAAPLVTFTVALLRSFGFGRGELTSLIKQRLYVSSDYDPALALYVAFSGRLNIGKALALYDDVLEVRDGPDREKTRLALGRWNPGDEESVALCSDGELKDFRPSQVWKITPIESQTKIRILYHTAASGIDEVVCKPKSAGLTFEETDGPKLIHGLRPWSEIVDYVSGYYVR